ncbi:MAG: hypothetical protein ABIL58_15115 [Pseudomonadota bacterium]
MKNNEQFKSDKKSGQHFGEGVIVPVSGRKKGGTRGRGVSRWGPPFDITGRFNYIRPT